FRWMGSGLVFFFAAALVTHFSIAREQSPVAGRWSDAPLRLSPAVMRTAMAGALVFSLLMVCGRGAQLVSAALQGSAESAASAGGQEEFYRRALAWNPYEAPTHFNFGLWLYLKGRAAEAVPHLRYATERGFNASACFAYLAAAEAGAGELRAAEQTLALAVSVYPRSVFLRVRHATALAEAGNTEEAGAEYAAALALDSRAARGWRQLICFGRQAAKVAAYYDKGIALAGELLPENCIFAVLDENERRTPVAVLEETSSLNAALPQQPHSMP
ncbi:MAG TPA: hypothetical protein VF723_16670, partial [Pyrinomonadaceae bacterium]